MWCLVGYKVVAKTLTGVLTVYHNNGGALQQIIELRRRRNLYGLRHRAFTMGVADIIQNF
jgi:hypothetical protein